MGYVFGKLFSHDGKEVSLGRGDKVFVEKIKSKKKVEGYLISFAKEGSSATLYNGTDNSRDNKILVYTPNDIRNLFRFFGFSLQKDSECDKGRSKWVIR